MYSMLPSIFLHSGCLRSEYGVLIANEDRKAMIEILKNYEATHLSDLDKFRSALSDVFLIIYNT